MLVEAELEKLHGLSTELHSLAHINTSICWQQSRLTWLREGYVNSKFFHGIMARRWSTNNITTILVNSVIIEGVDNVWFLKHSQLL